MRVMCVMTFEGTSLEPGSSSEKPPQVGSEYFVTRTEIDHHPSGMKLKYYKLEGFQNWYYHEHFAPLEGDEAPVIEEEVEEPVFANQE